MAKFFYRMQNILNIKYKLEDQAKIRYGQTKMKFEEETDKLKKFMNKKADYEKEIKENMKDKLDIQRLRQLNVAVKVMEEKIEAQKKEVIKAYKRMLAAKDELTQIVTDRKTHEKLRENAFDEFVREVNAEEFKEIDELISFKYNSSE